MIGQLVLLAMLGTAAAPLDLVDEAAQPIGGAVVTFVDRAGRTDVERSAADGSVGAATGFDPVSARIAAPGFVAITLDLASAADPVRLAHVLPIIARVQVATGSARNLHQLPVASSVLDSNAIASSAAPTSDALLRALPGFDRTRSNSAFTNYGQLRLSLSGAGNDRGLALVDGVPAQDAFGGQIDWLAYPPAELTRAEVLRGPGSALYGSGAIGGVLELRTRGPAAFGAPLGASGQASFEAGGYDASGASVFVQSSAGPRVSTSLWTSTTRLAYNDLPPAYSSPIDVPARSQSDATQLRVRFGSPTANLELSTLFATDAQAEGRPNYSFGRSLHQYALQYQRGNGHADTTISAYERDATVLNLADQFPKAPGVLRYIQHVPTWENGIEAVVRSLTARWDVQARAELRSVHGISDQRSGNGGLQGGGAGSQQLAGVAFQATLHGNRFEALAGARYDAATFAHGTIVTVDSKTHAATTVVAPSRTDAAISPRVALRYDLGQAVALRLSAGSGIREPYLNELVRGFQIGSTVFAPNVGLIPERSRSLSAGIDVAGAASHASLDFTQTVVNDAIAFLTVSPTLQQRANIDRTQTDGLTAVVERRLAGCTRVEASATTQFARVTQGPGAIVGKQLQFVPDRSISLGIDDDAGAIGLGIDASYIGQTYADDLNTEPLGAALVIGARATAPMSDGSRITLSWQNLTRQTYLTSVDRIAPPSNLILSYTLPIGGEARQPGRCRVR